MAAGNFTTGVVTTPPLTVNQFFASPPSTPGNVGVCLSGGGSRALTAGMGQLQGLSYLTANGLPLLSQVKALSTVSGGSWLGVPYEFLHASGPPDAAYLGTYNPNQGSVTAVQLAQLPAGNAGVPITSDFFLPELLAIEAFLLHEVLKVQPSMLWQTVIALNVLRAYGLFIPGADFAPTDLFSYDQQSLQAGVTGPNPTLSSAPAYLFADRVGTGRAHRPYLICNMAMLITEPDTGVKSLAAVQATPFFTGIVGSPGGTDANGLAPGGGGVTSFAFNSIYVSQSAGTATVAQTRQWSLTDIVGTSSAFFAEALQNQIEQWEENPIEFVKTLIQYGDEILKWIERHFDASMQAPAKALVQQHQAATSPEDLATLKFSLPGLQSIIPEYYYWPIKDAAVVKRPLPTRFTDGGSLDNTGINAVLAYADIDSVIAFVNTETPMALGQFGVSDGHGGFIPNTTIVVDEAIPPLFGYQPYESGEVDQLNKGYVLYAGAAGTDYPMYSRNQVFPSSDFPKLLQGLWQASGSGSNSHAAVFAQSLPVLANTWFGIAPRSAVRVVWCYLGLVAAWQNQFRDNPEVAAIVDAAVTNMHLPHYNTVDTRISATEVNLLSALTAWCVVSADQNAVFSGLFGGSVST